MRAIHPLLIIVFFLSCWLILFPTYGQEESSLDKELAEQRVFWNNALVHDTTSQFSRKPNALLMETVKGLTKGKALDIGMGQGRNTIFLAKDGWDVTGFDVADEAVNVAITKAKEEHLMITTQIAALERFDFGESKWDLIVHVYEGCLEGDNGKFDKITRALKPGGLLVFEFFHLEAGAKLGMQNFGCNAANTKDLVENSKQFTIMRYTEEEGIADFTLKKLKLIRMVARKTN